MLKRLLQKKNDGGSGMGDILGTAICLVVLFTVLLVSVHYYRIAEMKRMLNDYTRRYILVLESKGTLTQTQLDSLTDGVKTIGGGEFHDVTIAFNDTITPAGTAATYGQEVTLDITINATWEELGITRVLSLVKDNYVFHSRLYSTCKA